MSLDAERYGKPRPRRILRLRDQLLAQPGRRWTTQELATQYGVSPDAIHDDMLDLSALGVPVRQDGQTNKAVWLVNEGAPLPPLSLDYEQGTAFYVAMRLLCQQHDDQVAGIQSAISALVNSMPAWLRPQLNALTHDFMQRAQNRPDLSTIFAALANGWCRQHKVRLTYEPPQKRPFICTFAPYLVEPSGIGATIYFLGWCDEVGDLRTFKLERIRAAALLEETFTIPDDFDGVGRLAQAWRVMYGEEGQAVEIRLRFSPFVAARVRETRWHPSEHLTETPQGLEWTAFIGDVTEIKPWVRGWGSDCEVLEPASLRDEMQAEIRRMARAYGIAFTSNDNAGPDQTLLDDLLG